MVLNVYGNSEECQKKSLGARQMDRAGDEIRSHGRMGKGECNYFAG
jgi:hypothetical protein